MSEAQAVGSSDFDREVVEAAEPVIVDFWAQWCPPCRALSPVLDKVAEKFVGRVKVVKCDIDSHPELATKYGVMTIPNLIFFKAGQVVDQSVGYLNEAQLSEKVETVLKAA